MEVMRIGGESRYCSFHERGLRLDCSVCALLWEWEYKGCTAFIEVATWYMDYKNLNVHDWIRLYSATCIIHCVKQSQHIFIIRAIPIRHSSRPTYCGWASINKLNPLPNCPLGISGKVSSRLFPEIISNPQAKF